MASKLKKQSLEWYAVRLVVTRLDVEGHLELASGEHVYEETVRLVKAKDYDHCLAVAEKMVEEEAKEYGYFSYTGYSEGFKLFDDIENGAEIYSTLRKSKLEPMAYVRIFVRNVKEVGFKDPH
jgi:hypothetical protein